MPTYTALREHEKKHTSQGFLCTFMELVDREVAGKQKELLVGTLRGVLRAKVEQLANRAVPDINFPPGWI